MTSDDLVNGAGEIADGDPRPCTIEPRLEPSTSIAYCDSCRSSGVPTTAERHLSER